MMRPRATRALPALIAVVLTTCADPAAQQAVSHDREDARLKVLADAMFYWRCAHQPVVMAGECKQWSEAYERDLAAFKAKYGDREN